MLFRSNLGLDAGAAGFCLCTRTANLGLDAGAAGFCLCTRTANLGLGTGTAGFCLCTRTANLGLDAGAALGESFGVEGTCHSGNLGNLLNKKNLFRLIFHVDSEESRFSCKCGNCTKHC